MSESENLIDAQAEVRRLTEELTGLRLHLNIISEARGKNEMRLWAERDEARAERDRWRETAERFTYRYGALWKDDGTVECNGTHYGHEFCELFLNRGSAS